MLMLVLRALVASLRDELISDASIRQQQEVEMIIMTTIMVMVMMMIIVTIIIKKSSQGAGGLTLPGKLRSSRMSRIPAGALEVIFFNTNYSLVNI